jgi:Integrase core domain
VIRWHRAGFQAYWRWKSRPRGGRPKTPLEIRQLIREISRANPLWGAPRLHGELLKLGIDVGQTTVAKYMARGRRPPPQGKTFLHNHADGIASMDLFVVPTISFRLLYGLLILHHDRRQILWVGVTVHPTAEWISHQLTEAYGWKVAPRYIIRDRDAVYGDVFIRRLRAMSIRDRPTAPRSPWQNGYCERAIGSIRRECLDHVVVFGERHLQQGRAVAANGTCRWSHFDQAISWRTSSSVRASLISDRHRLPSAPWPSLHCRDRRRSMIPTVIASFELRSEMARLPGQL